MKSDLQSHEQIEGVALSFGVPRRQTGLGLFQIENNDRVFAGLNRDQRQRI